MRRSVSFLGGVLALSAVSFSTGAQAVERCYRLNPFIDHLKLEVGNIVNGHRNVYGNWIAVGSYTLPMSGALELNLGSATVRRLGITGTGGVVGGNLLCGLDGIPNGGWRFVCTGDPAGPFQQSGSPLTPISCAGLPPSGPGSRAAMVK